MRALNFDGNLCCSRGDAAIADSPLRGFFAVLDTLFIQESPDLRPMHGEIDVLRNVSRYAGDLYGVQFCDYHADHMATGIEQWAAAIAGLNGRTNLDISHIVL